MTKDELNTILIRCRKRANRVGIIFGTFGIICGIVGMATNVANRRGWLSFESLFIVSCLILLLTLVVLVLGLRYLRQMPAICDALCPNCGKSLVAQRDKVLATGICGVCNYKIFNA